MAGLPRCGPELRPLIRILAALLLLAAAAPIAGQGTEDGRGRVDTEVALTRLAGDWVPLVGAALSVRLTPGIEIGGAGRVALEHPRVPGGAAGLRVRFGYGGLRVTVRPAPTRLPGLRLAVLLGAGNADVHDPAAELDVDSDNGPVLEPALSWTAPLRSRLALSLSASYRIALGFDALGEVSSGDLRGSSFGAGLRLGPF